MEYIWETPEEITADAAKRLRQLRKRKGISQEELSRLSGVSYGSIKRFEQTGNISFLSLTKLAIALDVRNEIKNMFTKIPYANIQEVLNEHKRI